jgi:hypothetical protein
MAKIGNRSRASLNRSNEEAKEPPIDVMRMRNVKVGALVVCAIGTTVLDARADAKSQVKKECAAAAERGASLREQGEYKSARAALLTCARDVCSKAVSQMCAERLRSLDAVTPTVIPRAQDESGHALPNARVLVDGAPLAEQLDGKSVAADPGEHVFRFELTGAPPVEKVVVVRSGEKERLVSVVMHASAPAADVGSTELQSASLTAHTSDPPADHEISARGIASLSLLVLGVASVAIGEAYFARASDEESTASTLRAPLSSTACTSNASATCRELGDAVDAQHRDLSVGRVLVGTGVGLALAAAAAWVFWPGHRDAAWLAPSPTRGGGELTLGGAF